MYKCWYYLITLFLLLISTGLASQPLLQTRYDIDDIQDNSPGVSWRVSGKVADASPLGYGANDATTGMVVFCENEFGDIDRFIITNIISKLSGRLICDVIYNEEGTPRFGSPMTGAQILCGVSTNGVPYLPSFTVDIFNEYLQNGARNISLDNIIGGAPNRWAEYIASTTVDIGTNGIIFGGVLRTNWPTGGGGTGDVSTWATFPAIQDVDIGNYKLTNVNGITLGGVYRTNWPTGSGVATTNHIYGTFNIDPSGVTFIDFGFAFPVTPYVSFTLRDTNAVLLATANIIALTNTGCMVAFISSGDLITYPWTVDYCASCPGDVSAGGTGEGTNWSLYPAITNVNINNKSINNIDNLTASGKAAFKTFIMSDGGEQVLTNGATVVPYSNIKISNSGTVILGNPQIETNNVTEGTVIIIKGASADGVRFIDGNGLALNCGLEFTIKSNDVLEFIYQNGIWNELVRQDK